MKEKLLSALRIIGAGALYGLGFGLVSSGFLYYITQDMEAFTFNDRIADTVIITKSEETKLPESDFILGSIENRGTKAAHSVRITADFYDKQGKIVDQSYVYLHGSLDPGGSRHFKLVCSDSKGKMAVEHDSYKLVVSGI
jgi:hypothetical protein